MQAVKSPQLMRDPLGTPNTSTGVMHFCWAWVPFIALTALLLPMVFRLGMHRINKDGTPFFGAVDWNWNYTRRRNFDADGQRLFTWVRWVAGAWLLAFIFAGLRCP